MSILGVFKKGKNNIPPKKAAASHVATVSPKKRSSLEKKGGEKAWRVLSRPLITEKATHIGSKNQYVFEVPLKANKIEVKKAIAEVYGVRPMSVNMVNVSGKIRRFGRSLGQTKDRKKAIVTLKKGESIQIYEGV